MKIAALILAAGTSSRMGSAKQLLPYRQTTLLGWVIKNTLTYKVDSVYCVLGSNAEQITSEISKYPISIIYNKNYKKGLSSSIISGIEHVKHMDYDGVLISLGDQPNIDSLYVNRMISEFKLKPNYTIASLYKNIKGVPAIFPVKQYTNLMNMEGDKGAKLLLNSPHNLVMTIKGSVDLFDIDTPEDYDNFLNNS